MTSGLAALATLTWGDMTPGSCPLSSPPASPVLPDVQTSVRPSVYCVCALFTCFVCCHPASETRQTGKFALRTKCRALSNSLPLSHPFLQPCAFPHFPFPKGGSRDCPKIGPMFMGQGNYGDTINLRVSWCWIDFQTSLLFPTAFLPSPW